MKNANPIFESLIGLREWVRSAGSSEQLEAAEMAENIAIQEIFSSNLEPEGDNFAKVMSIVFPDLARIA
jgi:hypothetical protein